MGAKLSHKLQIELLYMYYFQNGLKAEKLENIDDIFIYFNASLQTSLITGKLFENEKIYKLVNNDCVLLYDIFLRKIFPDTDEYHSSLGLIPMWIKSAGHDSDSDVDRDLFEHLLNGAKQELVFKHLYYADCENLIGYLQSRIMGTKHCLAMFYVNLANCEPLSLTQKTTTIWMAGENTTTVFSLLVDFIVSLYAVLDITTKICYQLEHIPSDFSSYPSLTSSILYGKNKKDLKNISFEGTVFENGNPTLKLIENLRHELIHNGYWESIPKIFVEIVDGCVKNKWILMPDEINGNLVTFKNRRRFFSQGLKANNVLLNVYLGFLEMMLNTIGQLKHL